jgi:hypothetical protein
MDRLAHLIRFYAILDELRKRSGGPRTLATCSGRMNWPNRGVYFFLEVGQDRSDSGTGARVVRVGTHGLKTGSATKLWTRLSHHKGQSKTGGGNHRGSIFRLIVGGSLIAGNSYSFPTWGVKNTADAAIRAGELSLEREVSIVIGQMPFLWLEVPDEPGPQSARGYVERNAIALLSNFGKEPIDAPHDRWLGYGSDRERVRKSGLWNQNHVDESYDFKFLDVFEKLALNQGLSA